MTQEFQRGKMTVRSEDKVEVKVGSGYVIVEQSELDNLIEALSELKSLVAHNRALMNVGSA
jgi:prefoldin subunit 5